MSDIYAFASLLGFIGFICLAYGTMKALTYPWPHTHWIDFGIIAIGISLVVIVGNFIRGFFR